jgi:hypothetical protein
MVVKGLGITGQSFEADVSRLRRKFAADRASLIEAAKS